MNLQAGRCNFIVVRIVRIKNDSDKDFAIKRFYCPFFLTLGMCLLHRMDASVSDRVNRQRPE